MHKFMRPQNSSRRPGFDRPQAFDRPAGFGHLHGTDAAQGFGRLATRASLRGQRGMTFIGLLCILVLVGIIGYAGLRLAPLYLNYMKVARTMEAAAAEFKTDAPDAGTVNRSLERHWEIEDITGVDYKDVEVKKDDGALVLHVAYDDAVPYIANVSLSVHFDKTVKVQ